MQERPQQPGQPGSDATDGFFVQINALDNILLVSFPVALFEAFAGAQGDAAEVLVVAQESFVDRPIRKRVVLLSAPCLSPYLALVGVIPVGFRFGATYGPLPYMLLISASANPLHLTSLASSMSRAKS